MHVDWYVTNKLFIRGRINSTLDLRLGLPTTCLKIKRYLTSDQKVSGIWNPGIRKIRMPDVFFHPSIHSTKFINLELIGLSFMVWYLLIPLHSYYINEDPYVLTYL